MSCTYSGRIFRIGTFTRHWMTHFMMQLKRIHSLALACLLTFGASVIAQKSTAKTQVKFEVLSTRVLSSAEAASRSPDYLGPNVVVRLRLSNSTTDGFYFYTGGRSIIPEGFTVKQTDSGRLWLYGKPGDERTFSPGIERVTSGFPGVWVILPPNSAIEWEELDSTYFGGEKHAFTCFMKISENDPPVEIFSEWFEVPRSTRKPPMRSV
jgi:hypothetical protein